MSYALNAAIELPEGPLLLAIPAGVVALIVLVLGVVVLRKRKARKNARTAWAVASEELGIELVPDGSDLGTVATGKVNRHVVSIASVRGKGRKRKVGTQFSVKFEAPEAPLFTLAKRTTDEMPILDTGNPKFDAVVAVQTEQPVLLSRFLTGPRRAGILRLLTLWPDIEITNRTAHIQTDGIEVDHDQLVDSICHLVATAETFDRPTTAAPETTHSEVHNSETTPVDVPTAAAENASAPVPAPEPTPQGEFLEAQAVATEVAAPAVERVENGDADVLTEVRLDEITVLQDLFNSDLSESDITARFHQIYQGREVTWSGEVLRVGSFDETGSQRIAALVGSANGQDPHSGRVVALTAVSAEPVLAQGDVVSFSGSLVNLDANQRLFHIA